MLRLIFLILRFLFEIPFLLFQINKYKKNPSQYSLEERIGWTRKLLIKATKRARVKLEVSGQENLLQDQTYLITPNHQGLFDILAITATTEGVIKFVYKKELRKIGIVADVVDFMEYHYIDRENLRQSMKVIKTTTKELKEGITTVIFPEGTRSKNGNQIGEFKGGSFKAAIDAKVPIVPCAIIDSYQVLDKNSLKKITCQIHYFKPITYDMYKDLNSTEIALKVQNLIQDYINEHV